MRYISEMSDDKVTTFQDLADKAFTLQKKLKKLRQADAPVLLDVNYDACFLKVHQQLITAKNPSPIPRPLLRAKLLESLKNERESLMRVLADHNSRLRATAREIADWKERIDAVTRDAASPSVPSDCRTVRELARTRQNQIAMYLDDYYPRPSEEDQASLASAVVGEAAKHSGSCNYLSLSEFVEDLVAASTQQGDQRYVKLGSEHWLRHVELLLDSKVAERDPQRSDHIRLMDWD